MNKSQKFKLMKYKTSTSKKLKGCTNNMDTLTVGPLLLFIELN